MEIFNIAGLSIEVPLHVYAPSEDSFLLMKLLDRHLQKNPLNLNNKRILEIGCGSGAVTIYVRKLLSPTAVFATDLSIEAIKIAKRNVLRNGENIESYSFVNADLCSCFSSSPQFDLVMINPPYLPSDPTWLSADPIKTAVEGGLTGAEVLNSFLSEVTEQLSAARIAYVYSDLLNRLIDTNLLIHCGYEIVDRIESVFAGETIFAVMWERSSLTGQQRREETSNTRS